MMFCLWAEQIKRIIEAKSDDFDVKIVVCGSEESISRDLAYKYGFSYVEAPNRPLGRKANIRLQRIAQLSPDYVLFLGSDDLMSIKTWSKYENWMREGYDEIASMDFHLYDTKGDQAAYCHGYDGTERSGEPMAVGRCLHKSILEKMKWRLWDDRKHSGIDATVKKMYEIPANRKFYFHKTEQTLICGFKTSTNIWPFAYIPGRRSKCDREFILDEFDLRGVKFE